MNQPSVVYRTFKRMIERGDTEGLEQRIDVLYAAGKMSTEEYDELIAMLRAV